MAAISRIGDMSTGHGSFPPTAATAGSTDVFANGIGVVRVGDPYAPHGSPSPSVPHSRTLSAGSGSVFANGIAIGRIGDSISCGDASAAGSADVMSG